VISWWDCIDEPSLKGSLIMIMVCIIHYDNAGGCLRDIVACLHGGGIWKSPTGDGFVFEGGEGLKKKLFQVWKFVF
jgi:hypothetical protein